ncbi:MAG: hypothetical protein RRB22_14690, partial [Gammaproteobacteria bacterium]|nr:hypothetical protein [Gammaproteobacteria bacterium]
MRAPTKHGGFIVGVHSSPQPTELDYKTGPYSFFALKKHGARPDPIHATCWHVEVDFRNIKTTLGMETLSCKTPEMAEKEMWVYF